MTDPTGSRRLEYLEVMGIQAWSLRASPAGVAEAEATGDAAGAAPTPPQEAESLPAERSGAAVPVAEMPQRSDVSGLDWDELQARVAGCTLCELHSSRTQTVFGVGNRAADWLVIGEAPGKDEDQQGEPFVGRAGQLLNAMLQAIGLKRGQVYIANILKCRPPNNRDPKPEEVVCCEPYLLRQIALINPGIILAVGRISAQNLLQTDTPIGRLRGRVHRFRDTGIPLVATYHPAYLLRSPVEKRKAWQDLQLAVKTLRESAS